MDEFDITGGAAGIDRRDFIRKSALVGGMVWAAPMISSIGSPAFALTADGGGGNGEDNGNGNDISNVAFVLENEDPEAAPFKFDRTDEVGNGTLTDGNAQAQPCVQKLEDDAEYGDLYTRWQQAVDAVDMIGAPNPTVTLSSDLKTATITPPTGYKVMFAVVKAGNPCHLYINPSPVHDQAYVVRNGTGTPEPNKTF